MDYTNVGMGMVPHKKNCRCDECTIERLTEENERLNAVIKECGRDDALAYLRLEEIGTLQAKVERLEGVLQKVADSEYCADGYRNVSISENAMEAVKAALQESDDG